MVSALKKIVIVYYETYNALCEDKEDCLHYISAITADGEHVYSATIDSEHYGVSVDKVWNEMNDFLDNNCRLRYCREEVWFFSKDLGEKDITNIEEVDYTRIFDDMAHLFRAECTGFKKRYLLNSANQYNPLSWEEFVEANLPNNLDKPFASLALYHKYRAEIEKDSYNDEEIDRMKNFIMQSDLDSFVLHPLLPDNRQSWFLGNKIKATLLNLRSANVEAYSEALNYIFYYAKKYGTDNCSFSSIIEDMSWEIDFMLEENEVGHEMLFGDEIDLRFSNKNFYKELYKTYRKKYCDI